MYCPFSYWTPLTIFFLSISLPVTLFICLYPTGSMLRLSSQSKSTPVDETAFTRDTGICTRPKLIAPFQIARAICNALFNLRIKQLNNKRYISSVDGDDSRKIQQRPCKKYKRLANSA